MIVAACVLNMLVVMLAYAGIEAVSDLAPDINVNPRDLKRIVSVTALACRWSTRAWRRSR